MYHRVSLPITSYIQEDQLKKEFLHGLQQREINEKFHYIGEQQAKTWVTLCNSPEYEYYRNSKQLLENRIEDFMSDHIGDINIVALGSGDGIKEKSVAQTFLKKHRASLFFVDISREILNIGIKNAEDSDALKEVFVADVMNFMHIKDLSRYVKRHYNSTNFFTLLGNTLGNYPQAMILKTIRNAMAPGDKILMDVHVKSATSLGEEAEQVNEMVKGYNDPIFLEQTLASLAEAGIKEDDGIFEEEFGRNKRFPQMSVAEQYFCFKRSKTVTYHGEDIYFAKGERILVHYSNKYTFESLENLLTSHGLRIVNHATDDDERCYLVICELA